MRRSRLLAAAGFLFLTSLATAQSPSADWQTIETPHFRIHYPAPFEAWTKRAAARIEAIHERVTGFIGYAPGRPIEVLVHDPAAAASGMALPFLDRPVIILWTSAPEAESGIGFYNDWMEILVTHELAHIVHLTRPRNRSRDLLRRLSPLPFGPVVWKAPRWVSEGYATLVEGELTGMGRPRSSYRAMILRRFGMEGKLPDYETLSSTGGWLGGAMAYLVGSAYLEWLEEREGEGSLQKLWKRMASRRGGSFESAFRGVFGELPGDLYDRFQAEMTARALAQEKRLTEAGLLEGVLWQKLAGGSAAPQVSPDGTRLLARRVPKPDRGFLAVWEIQQTEEERKAEERRKKREEELLKDPEEVPERPQKPPPREPRWTLLNINGFSATQPRWMPGGKQVLFSIKAPDADGVLRADLYLWELAANEIRRLTEKADVVAADAFPDGRWLVGVQNRHGFSRLVRIDPATGRTEPLRADIERDDPWRVWTHPRVSPDGSEVAALLHSAPRWRLVVLPVEGDGFREILLPGSPAGPPAWSPDGTRIFVATDASGIWNIESVSAKGERDSRMLTRVTGGALSPAPHPDGKFLFFLEVTAKGFNLRRLDLEVKEPDALEQSAEASPILPPQAIEVARPAEARVGESHAYRMWPSHILRPSLSESVGPDGKAFQIGLEGSDVLGRLNWVAAASLGDAAGPRGGSLAFAYRGLPVAIRAHLFSALEKPGRQRVVRVPEFDQERRGGFLGLAWGRAFTGGRLRVEAGAGSTRIEARASDERFERTLTSARVEAFLDRTRGRKGFGFDLDAAGSLGETSGSSWSQILVGGGVSVISPSARLRVSARLGETGGSPSRFDLFALGGASSSILPAGLDRNRLDSPALPAYVQVGERLEALRAELLFRAFPLSLYAERLRAWNGGGGKPDPVRILGAEIRIGAASLPVNILGAFDLYAGIAKIKSQTPRFDSTRGYAGILYRP